MSRTWINKCVGNQEAVTVVSKLSGASHFRPYLIQGMAVAGVS